MILYHSSGLVKVEQELEMRPLKLIVSIFFRKIYEFYNIMFVLFQDNYIQKTGKETDK